MRHTLGSLAGRIGTRVLEAPGLPAFGAAAGLLLIFGTAVLRAQDTPPRDGLRLYSVSANAVYYSTGLPESGAGQPGMGDIPSDIGGGGSARIGWVKSGERSNASFFYTPSYTGRVRNSSWNAFNNSLSLNANRKLARKWSFGFSLAASLANREDLLFSPTVFSNLAALPTTFDSLASAMQTGRISDAQLASILTGALLVESPARNVFYGQRMFTSGLQTSLSYFSSPRFSVSFAAMGGRNQNISGNRSGAAQNSHLVDMTTSGGASVAVSYSHSPRTQLGAAVASSRVSSALQDVYTTTSTASFGRTIGQRWLVQTHGGVGFIKPGRQTIVLAAGPQPAFGGSLTFKTFSHSLLGSYDRIVSDSYGLGASSTSSVSTAWRWRRAGSAWSLDAGASRQELRGGGFDRNSSWRATMGVGRALGAQFALLTQYSYLHYSGLTGLVNTVSQSAVRVSVTWTSEPNMFR